MNKYRFKTSSTSSGRTITDLVNNGVRVHKPRKGGGELTFLVSSNHAKSTVEVINSYERVYEREDKRAFPRLIWRFGILIAIAVILAFLGVAQNYLLNIDVYGTNRISRVEVLDYLSSIGVKTGSVKSDFVEEDVERKLIEQFEFSVVDCSLSGTTLSVVVKEELSPPNYVDMQNVKSIVALEDAVVTRIVTLSGTKVVERGKSVQKGDLLIDGKHYVGEEYVECRAIGEVYGKVWRKREIFIPATITKLVRTGSETTLDYLSFGKVDNGIDSPYPYYEHSNNRVAISSILPFYKNTVTFYECSLVEVENPELLDVTNQVDLTRKALLLELENSGGIYLDSWHTVKDVEGGRLVNVVLEMECRIDTYCTK